MKNDCLKYFREHLKQKVLASKALPSVFVQYILKSTSNNKCCFEHTWFRIGLPGKSILLAQARKLMRLIARYRKV